MSAPSVGYVPLQHLPDPISIGGQSAMVAGTVVGDAVDISDIHDRYSGPNGEQLSDLELLQKELNHS